MAVVIVTPEAVREIGGLPTAIVGRMNRLLARLADWPNVSGVKRLKGDLAGKYRPRTGDYRLQFRVEQRRKVVKVRRTVGGKAVTEEQEVVETRVIVEKAGHRDGFYGE